MTTKVEPELYDEVMRAEQAATQTREDTVNASLRLSRFVSDMLADGQWNNAESLKWLAEYVDAFNEAYTASQGARSRWQSLAKQLLGE